MSKQTGREQTMYYVACPACKGDGWHIGHEDECHENGCVCSGVQHLCEKCGGKGQVVCCGDPEQEPGQ